MKGLKHFFKPYPIDTKRLSVHGIGLQEEMRKGMIDRPYGTGDYLLMYFHQPCMVRDSTEEALRAANCFIVWNPADSHLYGNDHARWTHSWLHCDGESVREWVRTSRVPINCVLPLHHGAAFEQYLEMLYRELTGIFAPDPAIASNLMENLFLTIGRSIHHREVRQIPRWLLETRNDLETHFTEPLNLKTLAEKCHRSIPYFCEQFKRHFDIPVIEYIIRLRLQRAAYLLDDHNLNIGEIGRLVGYDDMYHFSKLFKKHYGVSPRTYREQRTA